MILKVGILGSSLEYANNYFLKELCLIPDVEIVIYDLSKTSEHGVIGSKLVAQVKVSFPYVTIEHTEDLMFATKSRVLVFWGMGEIPDNMISAYKQFFNGKFKQCMESHMTEDGTFKPSIIFLRSHASGLKAASLLGNQIPILKKSISVLAGGIADRVYPVSDGTFKDLDETGAPPGFKILMETLQKTDGWMADVDSIVKFLKECVIEGNSSRDLYCYIGVFPDENDQQEWNVGEKVCLFMPVKTDPKYKEELLPILKNEEAAMLKIVN